MEFSGDDVVKTITVARDISKQKEISQKLDKYQNGLRHINYIASNALYNVDEQVNMALEVGRNYFGLDVGIIGQIEKNQSTISYTSIEYTGDDSIPIKNESQSFFNDITHHEDNVVGISNTSQEFGSKSVFNNHPVKSFIGIPYKISGKTRGMISFFSDKPKKEAFNENEIDFIKLFSKWVGFALEKEISKKSLLSEQDMMQAFATLSPAAVAMLNNKMEYLAVTERWRIEKGVVDKNIIGKCHYDIQTDIKKEWIPLHQKALAGESAPIDDDTYIDQKGNLRYQKWEAHPWYDNQNEIGCIIIFVDDITQLKSKESELKKAKTIAEKASLAIDRFLCTMSHEIRTPLNAVIGASHLLIDESPRKDQLENLTLLKNSGEHLLALVNDILDFSKIEEGQLRLEKTFFDFKQQVKTVENSLKYQTEEKQICLKTTLDEALLDVILGDPTRINQILINLISNAIKFTHKGHVEVKISVLNKQDSNCRLLFEVIDTGIGISKDKIESIFDIFTQADTDTTRKYGGSGLGLSISKIQVESVPKIGTNFYFELSVMTGTYDNLEATTCIDNTVLPNQSVKKVLLVEDHEVNKTLATKFLSKWGIISDWAPNGQVCLEKIVSKEYDLALMDLQMPVLDGSETTKAIRSMEDGYFKNIPIVALTAAALIEAQEKVKQVGMNDFVTKPFHPKEFHEKMEKYLNLKVV